MNEKFVGEVVDQVDVPNRDVALEVLNQSKNESEETIAFVQDVEDGETVTDTVAF